MQNNSLCAKVTFYLSLLKNYIPISKYGSNELALQPITSARALIGPASICCYVCMRGKFLLIVSHLEPILLDLTWKGGGMDNVTIY